MKKLLGYVTVIFILTLSLWLYVSFNGTPWGKMVSASKMESYIEDKYKTEFIKNKTDYNFYMGTYLTEFSLKSDPAMKVLVEESTNESHPFVDYYAEALWQQQLKEDFSSLLEKEFPGETILYSSVYGIGSDVSNPEEIPHYSQVNHPFSLIVKFERNFTEQDKENVSKKTYEIIKEIQKKELSNVELFISFDDGKGKSFTSINVHPETISNIKSEKDIYSLINTH